MHNVVWDKRRKMRQKSEIKRVKVERDRGNIWGEKEKNKGQKAKIRDL
jgi:hypothetical protein